MKLSLKATAVSGGVVWGSAMLTVGLIHMASRKYGRDFLRTMSSVYPGLNEARSIGRVLLGTAYGVADGAIAGLLCGALYDAVAGRAR